MTEEHFDALFNINVRGLFFTVQKALLLLSEGASVILNASVVAQSGLPNTSVYSATKAAVRSLGRTLAAELSPRGIRVNVVSPGLIETPFWGKVGLSQDEIDAFAGRPTRRPSPGQTRGNRRDRGISRLRRCQLLQEPISSTLCSISTFVDSSSRFRTIFGCRRRSPAPQLFRTTRTVGLQARAAHLVDKRLELDNWTGPIHRLVTLLHEQGLPAPGRNPF